MEDMLRGRKVTNPVVHGSINPQSVTGHNQDLNQAWQSVGKAKSNIRRIENLLGEYSVPPRHLNHTSETSIVDYFADNNKTYDADIFPPGQVDKYGRTLYSRPKNKNNPRKVRRLGAKYNYFMDVNDVISERRMDPPGAASDIRSRNTGKRSKDVQKDRKSDRPRVSSPKRVDFQERINVRDVNSECPYSENLGMEGHYRGKEINRTENDTAQTTLTDSRALRETEIRFLNNNLTNHNSSEDVRWENGVANDAGKHLAHVSVTVPGTSRVKAASMKGSSLGSASHKPPPTSAPVLDQDWETRSTDSAPSEEGGPSRRFRKTLKDIQDTDGLARLKATIRKQQEKAKDNDDPRGSGDMNNHDIAPFHHLHNDHDPLQPPTYDLPPPLGSEGHVRVRKVAAGPSAPTYKGFSEAEVKYKFADYKPPQVMDWRKREKKKKAALKLQEKRGELMAQELQTEVECKPKPKKMTRVVAGGVKKLDKPQKDIITTSSWRAGQELVLRELGPLKARRSTHASQANDQITENREEQYEFRGQSRGDHDGREAKSSTSAELERAKALSEEARKVLTDLHLGGSDEEKEEKDKENEGGKRKKPGVKRKAPKSMEQDKHAAQLAKQRHYDQDEVRRFMQKQKAERIKRQKEEERRQKQAMVVRQQQLKELESRQKQSAPKKVKVPQKKPSLDETFTRPITYHQLPHHHPFHEVHQDSMMTSDSEREPHGAIHREEDMEMSDESSTLTGESVDDTSVGVPSRLDSQKENVKIKQANRDRNLDQRTSNINSNYGENRISNIPSESANVKNNEGISYNLDGIMSKFSEALNNRGLDVNSGYVGSSSTHDSQERPPQMSEQARSKADRIKAIKDTATTLQRKIQEEAKKITAENPNIHSAWSLPRSNREDGDFVSRYDRITGVQQDYTVFTSSLPGQGVIRRDQRPVDSGNPVEAAAIRIQAAYRGHTVRQSLNWKLPSGDTVQASHHKTHHRNDEDESSITETSTFSEITITEDSEASLHSPNRQVGTGLREQDFHAGSNRKPHIDTEPNIPRPSQSTQQNRYSWDTPTPDPYSVFNILARHQRHQGKSQSGQYEDTRPRGKAPVSEAELHTEYASKQHAAVPRSSHIPSPSAGTTRSASPVVNRRTSPVVAARSDSPGIISASQKSNHAVNSRSEVTRPKTSVSFKPVHSENIDSDEDTIEGESYSKSLESDEEKMEEKLSKHPSEQISLKAYSSRRSPHPDSDLSSLDETNLDTSRPSPHGAESDLSLHLPRRYSPNSLERKFYAELTQLESMEESMRQLTGMERTRAVSMAQQETVSLAQMLKARQQQHDRDMKVLEIKAQQEAVSATKELEDARMRSSKAAQDAAETITRLRGDSVKDIQDSTQRLIRSQTEAAKVTAEAAKYLAQAKSYALPSASTQPMKESSDNLRPRRGKTTQSMSQQSVVPDTARSALTQSQPSYTKDTRTSTASKPSSRSVATGSVKTASDSRQGDGDSDSSIRSASGAEGHDESRSESISEDFNFDETMTEDEMEEKSFKAILPSESHRKRAKKQLDNVSVTSDEGSITAPSAPQYTVDDLGSIFTGEDSFNKFTDQMVRQFMMEEDKRAKHQALLLRLREKALMEKTKAELQWLEQQKQRIRNKGADDNFPQLVKKQRGLKLRLQEQQAEIKRLQEANAAASRERQFILQQHGQINKMRQSTKKTVEKLKTGGKRPEGRLGRPSEVHTEDEVSVIDEHSDAVDETWQKKDYKSDSEIYTEPKAVNKKGKLDSKSLEKMKKIHLDEKYLTAREHKLLDRRKNAEELLKWKQKLDEEEKRIYKLEQMAAKKVKGYVEVSGKKKGERREDKPKPTARNPKESQTTSTIQDDMLISENITTAKDDSVSNRKSETPRTEIMSGADSSPEELKREASNRQNKGLGRSGSESSIAEEVQSVSSIEEASPNTKDRKSRASLGDNTSVVSDTYGDETFEKSSVLVSREKSRKSPRSPLDSVTLFTTPLKGPRSISSQRKHNKGRSSESESEESISHTDVSYGETMSDYSDYEGRVRDLREKLHQRKSEADRLKKEHKKRKREILKSKEEALKKQIEAYDNQIVTLKAELKAEKEHEPLKPSVKPVIKHPKVSPTKTLKKPELLSPKSVEEMSGTDSTQSSPSIVEDKDLKPGSPSGKTTPVSSRLLTQLDKISEGSESSRSPVRKTADVSSEKTSVTEEIEHLDDAASESESSALLKIPKSPVKNLSLREDSLSYTQDFEEPVTGTLHDKVSLPLSARSIDSEHSAKPGSISEHITEQYSHNYSEQFHTEKTESFIKPLNLQKSINDDNDLEQVSPRSQRSNYSRSDSISTRDDDFEASEFDPILDKKSESEFLPASVSDRRPQSQLGFNKEDESIRESIVSEEELSEISKRSTPRGGFLSKKSSDIDMLLDLNDEDEDTPIASPREEIQAEDAMADFNIGDRVLVTGPKGSRKVGSLLYKGSVSFAPGIWAGVELDAPEGRNDGSHDGKRYFTCRQGHGVLVPGDDLMPAPVPTPRSSGQGSPVGRINDELLGGDQNLEKFINEADQNVQILATQKEHDVNHNDKIADRITDQLLESVVRENINTMSEIAQRKAPPPVAPKPKRNQDSLKERNENLTTDIIMNGTLSSPDTDSHKKAQQAVDILVNEAIDKMIPIHKKQRGKVDNVQEDLMHFEGSLVSPTKELDDVLNREDVSVEEEDIDVPPRPSSPMPGSTSGGKEDYKRLNQDIDALFDDEYIDDGLWTPPPPNKAPPPYPGSQDKTPEVTRNELQKVVDEEFFAVPHNSEEVTSIVSDAVEVYWQRRQCGEMNNGLAPPESFFTTEEEGESMENKSKRVYKKLLFDLTGEIIKEVYKNEHIEAPPVWQKPKHRRQKHFRGASPPSEVDLLKPIVQAAVIDTLGLNGSRKADKNKWSVRKKKDHVDNILVQELKEEEPQWVNYDDDEVAVKMQLTETIFDSLLTDTVHVISKIYRKRQGVSRNLLD